MNQQDFRDVAQNFRNQAKDKNIPLVDRARLNILADELEKLGRGALTSELNTIPHQRI